MAANVTESGARQDSAKPLSVAISSRALFDLSASNAIYEEQGLEAYRRYQIAHEDSVLEPGDGYALVQKLLNINELLGKSRVEVVLISRNSADTGLRVFNSIRAYGLDISRAAFCGGESPYRYIAAFGCDLFLSTDGADVRRALEQNVAAAQLLGRHKKPDTQPGTAVDDATLRLAFDGDAVLFSDEAERVFQTDGLDAFSASESAQAQQPLGGGPFKAFLGALHRLQQEFPEGESPIRSALVTARGAPAHERVIRTLRDWDIRLDESLFLGGMDKTEFLRGFGADIFFDDQTSHCERAAEHVATGHVPHGVANS
ncbi:MAG: 5'-nucleotidase [Pseudomonadota bacterium]